MALANFFDKSALAASQILNGYDRTAFESRLLNCPIELAFDQSGIHSAEAKATLDLTIRLLARLYPVLILTELEGGTTGLKQNLTNIALSINPAIEFQSESPVTTIVVGSLQIERETSVFYIGSEGWIARFSPEKPVGSGMSLNPLAAGAAACFGVANVFRQVFGDQLQRAQLDTAFNLSLIDFEKINSPNDNRSDNKIGSVAIRVPETVLVGLGAIGNGMVWALSNIPLLEGTLHLVDPECIDLSNLQRYVLSAQENVGQHKTELAASYLSASTLRIALHGGNWASFLNDSGNWNLETVIVAVDSAKDRIAIQGTLPNTILNAWTQSTDLGVSRHLDFLNDACLACLYPPRQGVKSESLLIAESFGLPQDELLLREMVYNNAKIDDFWLAKIAEAKSVPLDLLTPYVDKPIREFYHTVFCGGILIGHESNRQVETPMAFQSALAGILLASELLIINQGLRRQPLGMMTRIDLLRPLGNHLNEAVLKPHDTSCICQDPDFRHRYETKFAINR